MNGNDDCRTYVEHLRIEHTHIDQSLEELQHLLANAAAWSQENPALALLARLVQLRQQLVHHFREEEEGGCMEEARSRSPCLSEDVRTLQAEHAGFLTALDNMIAEAEILAKQPNDLQGLQQSFSGFLHRLHAHEAEENRILLFGFGSPAMDTLSTT
jgi:hemerythrin-like domain-containing protein